MLTPVDAPVTELYDGLDDGYWNLWFALPVGGQVRTQDMRSLYEMAFDLGPDMVAQVLADGRFTIDAHQVPRGHRPDLNLYYLCRGDLLCMFGCGETQPARYRVYFEAAWRIS